MLTIRRVSTGSEVVADPLHSLPLHVLVMIADPAKRDFCMNALARAGHQATAQWDNVGLEALIQSEEPDVILVDAAEFDDGHALSTGGMGDDPAPREIPVVELSSGAEQQDHADADGLVAGDLFALPISQGNLIFDIQLAVRLHCSRIELRRIRDLHGEQTRMWGVLLDFCRLVAQCVELDAVLELIVRKAAQLTCSRRVSLMLPDDQEQFLTIAKAIGIDKELKASIRVPIGEAVAGRAYTAGQPLTAASKPSHTQEARPSYAGESFVSMPILSTALGSSHKRVGVLNITHRYGDQPFEAWELEFVDLFGSVAGAAIDDFLSRQAREGLVRVERELQLAREIQHSALPDHLPELKGYQIDAWSESAEETGGDVYDVFGFQNDADDESDLYCTNFDRAILMLADATGHGISAALSVSGCSAMLRMAVRLGPDLVKVVRRMNDQLCLKLHDGRFVTAWLAELNAIDNKLSYFSAGQAPIFRYEAAQQKVHLLEADSMPLGIESKLEIIPPHALLMQRGDIVLVASDGVFETRNPVGEAFDCERVKDLILAHHDESASEILARLRAGLNEFAQATPSIDDRTAIVIKRSDG